MHLGFVLDLSDIDLQDMDLSDTDFLLDTDVASKHFAGLQDVFKMSSRRRQRNNFLSSKTSCMTLQDVFKTSSTKNFDAEDMLKTSSRPTNVCWGGRGRKKKRKEIDWQNN